MACGSCCGTSEGTCCKTFFTTYSVPRQSTLRTASVKPLMVLIIIGVIIVMVFVNLYYTNGHQVTDQVSSIVNTKLYGVQWSPPNSAQSTNVVYDVGDYIVPPRQNSVFFVATRMITVDMQKRGVCAEDPDIKGAKCENDSDCLPVGSQFANGNGLTTGKCVQSTVPGLEHKKVCQVSAWCPTLHDGEKANKTTFHGIENITVFIRNTVEWTHPDFGLKKRNIESFQGPESELKDCRWKNSDNKSDYLNNKHCPVFRLGDILTEIRQKDNLTGNHSMLSYGAVITINIKWDCNLDIGLENCNPEYSFRREYKDDENYIKGYDMRYAYHYFIDSELRRSLVKAYGLRFVVQVTGTGRKWSIPKILVVGGTTISYIGSALFIIQIWVQYCLWQSERYRRTEPILFEERERETENGETEMKMKMDNGCFGYNGIPCCGYYCKCCRNEVENDSMFCKICCTITEKNPEHRYAVQHSNQ